MQALVRDRDNWKEEGFCLEGKRYRLPNIEKSMFTWVHFLLCFKQVFFIYLVFSILRPSIWRSLLLRKQVQADARCLCLTVYTIHCALHNGIHKTNKTTSLKIPGKVSGRYNSAIIPRKLFKENGIYIRCKYLYK